MKIINPRYMWNRTVWWVGDPEGEEPVTRVTRYDGNNRWTLERWDHGEGEAALHHPGFPWKLATPWLTLTRKAHIMALLCEDDFVLSDPPSSWWDKKDPRRARPRHLPFCPWTMKSTVTF